MQGWLFSSDSRFWKPPQMKVNIQLVYMMNDDGVYCIILQILDFSYSISQPLLLSAGALAFGSLWQNDSS